MIKYIFTLRITSWLLIKRTKLDSQWSNPRCCHCDNFQCNQWWIFHQNNNICVSVMGITKPKTLSCIGLPIPHWQYHSLSRQAISRQGIDQISRNIPSLASDALIEIGLWYQKLLDICTGRFFHLMKLTEKSYVFVDLHCIHNTYIINVKS